jgi:hypothetical protein
LIDALVAFVLVQVRVVDWPAVTEVGFAEIELVGAGTIVTVA